MGAARVEIPILAATAGDHVHIEVQWSDQGDTAPAATSILWRTIAKVSVGDLPETVTTDPVPRGFFLWYRSSAWEDGARVSNFSDPVAVEIPELAEISGAELVVDKGGAVAVWAENDLVDAVAVSWSITQDGGEHDLRADGEVAGGVETYAVPVRPGMTEEVRVDLTPIDADDAEGETVTLTAIRRLELGTTTCPQNLVLTSEGHPVRASDACLVLLADLDLEDDWILTTEGHPVRTANFDIVRTS